LGWRRERDDEARRLSRSIDEGGDVRGEELVDDDDASPNAFVVPQPAGCGRRRWASVLDMIGEVDPLVICRYEKSRQ
jgi:hypothetical protein